MDKEKEVKRDMLYQPKIIDESEIIDPITISKKRYLALVSEIKRADDAEEALKAERTKREEAEKALDCANRTSETRNKTIEEWSDRCREDEAKIDGLEKAYGELMSKHCDQSDKIDALESQLATANAKIVELEKKVEFAERATCLTTHGWIYFMALEDGLSTANKKAEKLVEALEKIDRMFDLDTAKQALKEFRDGE